jgi:hypothetical protein
MESVRYRVFNSEQDFTLAFIAPISSCQYRDRQLSKTGNFTYNPKVAPCLGGVSAASAPQRLPMSSVMRSSSESPMEAILFARIMR